MSEIIRCGIIGCGKVAPVHFESFGALAGVRVAWACDVVKERAEAMARRYGADHVTTRYQDLLADPALTCVSICTPHASHAEIAVAALQAGKHVLCEKALAATVEGMDRMLSAHAERPQLIFGAVFQHRFDAVWQYLRKLVGEGAFGAVLNASLDFLCLRTKEYYQADKWRGTWAEEGGGVLINQAIHFIDALSWVMGGVKSLVGHYANVTHRDVIETEDTAAAVLRYRCGAMGTIEATSSSHLKWDPNVAIRGTVGCVEIRDGKPTRVDFHDPALTEAVTSDLATCRDAAAAQAGKSHYGPSHPALIADFVEAIRTGQQPFVTAESARHAVDIVLAIYRSYHAGAWVNI